MSSNVLNIFTSVNNTSPMHILTYPPNASTIFVYAHYYLPAWLWLPTQVSSALLTHAWVSQPLWGSPDRLGKDDSPWLCPPHWALIPHARPQCPAPHGSSRTLLGSEPSLRATPPWSTQALRATPLPPLHPVTQPMQTAAWWCSHLTIIGLNFSGRGKGNWRKSFSFIK